jgi:hypothetical protein
MSSVVTVIDLTANFHWPRNTSQSEFSIKNYDHLKLADFDHVFHFFLLFSSVSTSQQLYEPDLSFKNEQEGYNEA